MVRKHSRRSCTVGVQKYIIFVKVSRQNLRYKYTSAPQPYSFSCCAYAPYRSLNLTTHTCYEAVTAKRLQGFFSTLRLNGSHQQRTRLGSPTRTLNVSKRHPQGQVGTGVLCVELSVVYQLLQHSYLYNCSQ